VLKVIRRAHLGPFDWSDLRRKSKFEKESPEEDIHHSGAQVRAISY
jgi:hypothetical protein